MNNRNNGLIATVASALLCGCPGLFLCIFGAVAATGNATFNLDLLGTTDTGTMPAYVGVILLCISIFLILIPIVIGVVTLRKKPEAVVPVSDEPLPPAS